MVKLLETYDVIQRPIITEKSTMLSENNQVVFLVNPTANKSDVKRAVKEIFNVYASSVSIINAKGKTKKFRGRAGVRKDNKKAIVTIKQGQTIDLNSGVK